MSAPLLEVDRLTAGYNGTAAVRELSLMVQPGEVVALLGANGAGKTTTLRAISGTVRPLGGEIRFCGDSVAKIAPQALVRRGIGHVPEGRGLFFGLTVREHFRLAALELEPSLEAFPALGALRNRRVGLLSGGEQQMLSLAWTMARRPRLLLVDELSLGLAPVIVDRLMPLLRSYADDAQAGVLIVEQHVKLALEIADRGYVLSHGEVLLDRPAAELRDDGELLLASYLGEDAAPSQENGSHFEQSARGV